MQAVEFEVVRLRADYPIKPFDCGDEDLNAFLSEKAQSFAKGLIAVTYMVESEGKIAAFYSLQNDAIRIDDKPRSVRDRIKKLFPRKKHFSSYPAVKIGRLGVANQYKGQGLGKLILNYIKGSFIYENKTGCRFVTVDSYAQSIEFYEKQGFKFLIPGDTALRGQKTEKTALMYFDLQTLVDLE